MFYLFRLWLCSVERENVREFCWFKYELLIVFTISTCEKLVQFFHSHSLFPRLHKTKRSCSVVVFFSLTTADNSPLYWIIGCKLHRKTNKLHSSIAHCTHYSLLASVLCLSLFFQTYVRVKCDWLRIIIDFVHQICQYQYGEVLIYSSLSFTRSSAPLFIFAMVSEAKKELRV